MSSEPTLDFPVSEAVQPSVSFTKFVWLWNHLQGRSTPALHLRIAGWLDASRRCGDRRLLLTVFRDAGKSTLVALYCAWRLALDPNLRILVLAAEHDLAVKMTRNVRGIVERHLLTRQIVPDIPDLWAADQFRVRRPLELRDPSLLARGIGGNITGSRADLIVCDDVEVPNTCDTPGKRADLRDRLGEASFILVPGGTQLYVGTPHSFHTIYAERDPKAPPAETGHLAGFRALCVPILDEAGRSAWPDRFPPAKIEEIRAEAGPARFRSQMLLVPTHVGDIRLDPTRLVRYADDLDLSFANGKPVLTIAGHRMAGACCWWDPAYGAPRRGDATVVACVFTDEQGGYWLHDLAYLTHDPGQNGQTAEAVQLCRQVIDFARRNHQPSVTVETNGIGGFLAGILRQELRLARLALPVIEHRATRNKVQRILDAFDPVLAAGRLHAHARIWLTPFVAEMREWQPLPDGRDDGLDAVAGCLASQPARLARLPTADSRPPDWRGGAGYVARTDFTA